MAESPSESPRFFNVPEAERQPELPLFACGGLQVEYSSEVINLWGDAEGSESEGSAAVKVRHSSHPQRRCLTWDFED